MSKEAYMKLISGSDIRGYANEHENHPVTLTGEVAARACYSFALWLSKKINKPLQQLRVAIGRDSRVSGSQLLEAAVMGLLGANVAYVADCGLCTTPAMFMTTVMSVGEQSPCDGAVMITASHLPWYRNGLKFCTADGGLLSADIRTILEMAAEVSDIHSHEGIHQNVDFLPIYEKRLSDMIANSCGSLRGLRVAVDAGNGAGGFYAQMLEKLGADITGSQFLDPDGTFPNHVPNPEDPEAMASISKAVLNSGADMGIIFDTDCDRAAIVDSSGREINRNRLIALMAAVINKPDAIYVTDSVTSLGLTDFIQSLGAHHHRFKRGYRNVIDECKRLNAEGKFSPLAIETSGHAAFADNYYLDDGAYLITLLVIKAMELKKEGKTLASLIENLKEPLEAAEIRLPIKGDTAKSGQMIIDTVIEKEKHDPEWELAADSHDGVRVMFDFDGKRAWFMLRLSLHDPVLPFNAESDIIGGVGRLCGFLYDLIKDNIDIDPTPLKNRGDFS